MDYIIHQILPFIVALSIIVFVHEYGHFWVARRNGVKVDVFSIGFGHELFGWTDSHGTRWQFSLIPLGGYVKMHGDENAASQPSESSSIKEEEKALTLQGKTPLQRIAVAAAGPLANFIFSILVFFVIFNFKGEPIIQPVIGKIFEHSAAERSGLQVNDKILKVQHVDIKTFLDIKKPLSENAGTSVPVLVERDGTEQTVTVDLFSIDDTTQEKTPVKTLGISPKSSDEAIQFNPLSFMDAVKQSFYMTYRFIVDTLVGFGVLITGGMKGGQLGGILSIGDAFSQAASDGIWPFLQLMAWISIQLGVINLFPVPVLDGGHILMNTVELIIRRPIPEIVQLWFYRIGATLVIGLMSYAMLSDVSRYKLVERFLSMIGVS
ncbi:MAG TPA: RIP metalloprotease RseP [Holosporales bacterium]|nr:RIP metalloprotease RseP [Holosporales bacterium]